MSHDSDPHHVAVWKVTQWFRELTLGHLVCYCSWVCLFVASGFTALQGHFTHLE